MTVPDLGEQQRLAVIQRSGLFDGAWFLANNRDLGGSGPGALIHWHRYGWREGRWPNPYFDPAYYLARNPDCPGDPLLHYIQAGEAGGRRPILYFDPAWYRIRNVVPAGESCLAHFLRHRRTGQVSPVAEFDSAYYLRQNPDVASAGMDPMEHYRVSGFAEGRAPCPGFDPRRWQGAALDPNPVIGLLRWREESGLDRHAPNIADEVRRNTRPNAAFEEVAPLPPGLEPQAKLLAYYLPQFHPVPENEAWWGRGFTEWTNLGRALPRFAGHYQPRTPRDLGHYRLDGTTDTLRRQIALAKGAGLYGFVFYFYWFNGRRLLEAPLEALLADPGLDMPFCLMWANENWTRRWDGSDDQVLLSQDYRPDDEGALVEAFARHFKDPRYIRLAGRPVLMVYRVAIIPDAPATVARWRHSFRTFHGEDPVFVMAQSFQDTDPRPYGMDVAVEFPPHKLTARVPMITDRLHVLDPAFDAEVYDYAAIARASVAEPAPPYPLIKTAVPGWDNDPRRQGAGTILHGATPALYQAWLADLVRHARENRVEGEAIVCINAWNEWAEGATLEPDVHWGGAFLNATSRAVAGLPAAAERARLLLVGHDALAHGAQILLLRIGRAMREQHGVDIAFLLLGGGVLEAEYRAVAPTTIMDKPDQLDVLVRDLRAMGRHAAIVSSAASARVVPLLKRHGVRSVLLVHEMPRLLVEKGLVEPLRQAFASADTVVFPAGIVRDQCYGAVGAVPGHAVVLPQGVASDAAPPDREVARAGLGMAAGTIVALGMGYADLRKGFDLFLQVWRAARQRQPNVCFVWAGGIDPTTEAYLHAEVAGAEATGSFRFLGPRTDPETLLVAADVFVLTSREDPLPSVALEAMSAGTPVVAFDETGGVPDLLARLQAGWSVPLGDADAMARAVLRAVAEFTPDRRATLARASRDAFRFDAYSAGLLALADPGLQSVSVVVPNYNYGRFMAARLASIFTQTHPVAEIILLDDASTDDSVGVARETARAWGRRIRLEQQARRSGSVFTQWRRAAEMASGEWLWIAEADDLADPGLLATLVAAAKRAGHPALAFCDSAAIDQAGTTLWPDHKTYYGPAVLGCDAVFDGVSFLRSHMAERNLILNVSAVLWRRDALLTALRRCEPELRRFRVAGDWRIYAEVLARQDARIAYVAQPLNRHRRHSASVTARISAAAHSTEIARVQGVVARMVGADAALRRRQRQYRQSLDKGPLGSAEIDAGAADCQITPPL